MPMKLIYNLSSAGMHDQLTMAHAFFLASCRSLCFSSPLVLVFIHVGPQFL